jgi:catechol 2,3-dioxygenase-like lactoylglutathione lyase family enzyme
VARIARVAHVVLPVKDTKEAIDWYVSALGMELMAHDQEMDLPAAPVSPIRPC